MGGLILGPEDLRADFRRSVFPAGEEEAIDGDDEGYDLSESPKETSAPLRFFKPRLEICGGVESRMEIK